MRHRTASAELGLEIQEIGYKLGPMPCCYCSTTEGEPELTSTRETHSLHPYTGAMMRDLTVEQCHTANPEQNRSVLTQPRREVSNNVSHNHPGRRTEYASKCPPSLLPSK